MLDDRVTDEAQLLASSSELYCMKNINYFEKILNI